MVTVMSYSNDRRDAKRISYICEVQCEGNGVSRLATRINDLSLTGAFIDSVTCYPTGTVLRLRFHILDVLIETRAEVRYSMPRMGMGVHFLDLQPAHIAALECLIDGKPMDLSAKFSEDNDSNRRDSDGSNTTDMLLGNFAVVSMFDVIQIIENNRLGGELTVTSLSAKGEIQFNEGQIVGAHSGRRIGTDALKDFLHVTEGSFEFKRTSILYPRKIEASSNMSRM